MPNNSYKVYEWWLNDTRKREVCAGKRETQDSLFEDLKNSVAYQSGATKNGENQPIVATRSEMNKCKITVLPGDNMCIGDLIHVFNEYWLCKELHTDEYGITHGELWMCNHIFRFQNRTPDIIQKYAIIDDGSYSQGSEKSIRTIDNGYDCYISLDSDTEQLYVDKRLALDVIYDKNGDTILEVGKIGWIDKHTCNYGEGSHMIYMRLDDDVFNRENDSLDEYICDYIEESPVVEGVTAVEETPAEEPAGYLTITGRDTIRTGTSRTYKVSAIDKDGNTVDLPEGLEWQFESDPNVLYYIDNIQNESVKLNAPLLDECVGLVGVIYCTDKTGVYRQAKKEVVVISIG